MAGFAVYMVDPFRCITPFVSRMPATFKFLKIMINAKAIRAIKPGTIQNFQLASDEQLFSARSLVSYCNKVKKPEEVRHYSTFVDWENKIIAVCSIAK